MNNFTPEPGPKKLHSPLLEGPSKIKGKKTYYNPKEEEKITNIIDYTLDTTIFNKNERSLHEDFKNENKINKDLISTLEVFIKITTIFICAIGGIVSIIEVTNITRAILDSSYNFGNSIITFFIAISSTLLSTIICLGFLNLTRTIKFIYQNIHTQNNKIEKILNFCNLK